VGDYQIDISILWPQLQIIGDTGISPACAESIRQLSLLLIQSRLNLHLQAPLSYSILSCSITFPRPEGVNLTSFISTKPMQKILDAIDAVSERAGAISSWFVAALIAVILYEVIARYVFNAPTTWGFSTFRMLGGVIVVLGWAYAQRHNSHIRVDIFYTRLSPRQKALIDVIGTGIFFFPLFGAFIVLAGSSMWNNFLKLITEGSYLKSPANLLYAIILFTGLCLFFLQFVARFIRDVNILIKDRLR